LQCHPEYFPSPIHRAKPVSVSLDKSKIKKKKKGRKIKNNAASTHKASRERRRIFCGHFLSGLLPRIEPSLRIKGENPARTIAFL